jgi:hypothetical protein
MKIKFGIYTRFQMVLLGLFSPKRLVRSVIAGFLSAVDSMDDEELKELVMELEDAN